MTPGAAVGEWGTLEGASVSGMPAGDIQHWDMIPVAVHYHTQEVESWG